MHTRRDRGRRDLIQLPWLNLPLTLHLTPSSPLTHLPTPCSRGGTSPHSSTLRFLQPVPVYAQPSDLHLASLPPRSYAYGNPNHLTGHDRAASEINSTFFLPFFFVRSLLPRSERDPSHPPVCLQARLMLLLHRRPLIRANRQSSSTSGQHGTRPTRE